MRGEIEEGGVKGTIFQFFIISETVTSIDFYLLSINIELNKLKIQHEEDSEDILDLVTPPVPLMNCWTL